MQGPRNSLEEILREIRGAGAAVIGTHENPDGDAVGSMLAMASLLESLGVGDVACMSDGPLPRECRELAGIETIRSVAEAGQSYPLFIMLDASRRDRLGEAARWIGEGTRLVVIDHHRDPEPDGDLSFVDPTYASVGEIVVELYDQAGVPIRKEAAESLYVALATDTGGFQFGNTTPRTFRMAARLLECGIDAAEISAALFRRMSRGRFALMARIVERMEFCEGGRIAISEVTARDLEDCGAQLPELNNLVNLGRDVEGVRVAVLLRALEDHVTKVSLRSVPGFDAAEMVEPLGGGGHAGAAGVTLEMPLEQARRAILDQVRAFLGAAI